MFDMQIYSGKDILNKLIIIAGPCLAESESLLFETAEVLVKAVAGREIDFYFKASYRKANRSSVNSFSGAGDELALKWIAGVGEKFKIKTITDIHSAEEAGMAYKDINDVIDAVSQAGISKPVVGLKPIGNIKG